MHKETVCWKLRDLGLKSEGMLISIISDHLVLQNWETADFEDELRFVILPLSRKELRGMQWKRMIMTLRVRKTPLKFDIIDSGDAAGERHLFESTDEQLTASWIKNMIEEYSI
jgi:hypothetical protein